MTPRRTLTLAALRERREEIVALAKAHGAHNVRVFGSIARGEASDASDIDLLVDFDAERSLMDHGELLMDLEENLGCRVDLVSARGLAGSLERRGTESGTASQVERRDCGTLTSKRFPASPVARIGYHAARG